MNMNSILQRADEKMLSLYGESVPLEILSRFYSEKILLAGCDIYMKYLDLLGKVRERAGEIGEHVMLRGAAGDLFIAWLLGTSEINPLPLHEYCPKCKRVQFSNQRGTPLDKWYSQCTCGEKMVVDGWDLPYEMALSGMQRGNIQLATSHGFFAEAKRMFLEGLQEDHAVVELCDGDMPTLTLFVPLDEGEESKTISFKENHQLFRDLPHITLVPSMIFDNYREIEAVTGVKMRDAHDEDDGEILQAFLQGNVEGIPYLFSPNGFVKHLIEEAKPTCFCELLQILGLAHGTNIWLGNADKLFTEHRFTLRDIPVFADDVFAAISEKLRAYGIYDNGFAFEVAQKVRHGDYKKNACVDEMDLHTLLDLGFDLDWIFVLENTLYSLSKAQCAVYLADAKKLMWYKMHFPNEFDRVFGT